ncbi:MAG: cation:proton antiporter subunit C [Candidatus Omnitrophica bacterium]|nr:cation:proton antiporter subunit C [Candidatus Omnitrophota bacterium]
MIAFFTDRYAYIATVVLLLIGLGGMLLHPNLLKKLIGLGIFQSGIILFYINVAANHQGTVPVLMQGVKDAHYTNPLPHVLMLTAIVVGVATLGVGLALLISLHSRYKTLEEPQLLESLK